MMKDFKGNSYCSKIAWLIFAEWFSSFLSPASQKDAIPVIKPLQSFQVIHDFQASASIAAGKSLSSLLLRLYDSLGAGRGG